MKPFLFTCGLVLACLSTLLSVPGPAWGAASAPPVRRYVDAAATGGGDGTVVGHGLPRAAGCAG